LQEFAPGGDLFEALKHQASMMFRELEAVGRFLHPCLQALAYLHDRVSSSTTNSSSNSNSTAQLRSDSHEQLPSVALLHCCAAYAAPQIILPLPVALCFHCPIIRGSCIVT
jgi:hypothetical protein